MSVGVIVALLVAGVLLLIAEVFVPGAIAGIAGVICLAVGIVMAFTHSPMFGLVALVSSVVFGLLAFWAWLKWLPQTSAGKRLFLSKDGSTWKGYQDENLLLLGRAGVAETILRPAGVALIDGRRVDVVTQGELLDKGQALKVVRVQGNRVVVAAADGAPA